MVVVHAERLRPLPADGAAAVLIGDESRIELGCHAVANSSFIAALVVSLPLVGLLLGQDLLALGPVPSAFGCLPAVLATGVEAVTAALLLAIGAQRLVDPALRASFADRRVR